MSDWGSVHDICRSVAAGLDLQMPSNSDICEILKKAVDEGKLSMEAIDNAVRRLLSFALKEKPKTIEYDRKKQHKIAREIAADGIVLLKNDNEALPLTVEKYKKLAVIGEFAVNPLISGQGSAEVFLDEKMIDSPLEEIKKLLGEDIEVKYGEFYKKSSYSETMLWPKVGEFKEFIDDCDAVVLFIGSMTSEDTECFDRRCATFNDNYEMFVKWATETGKKVIVVMQNGGAMILGDWYRNADSILEMWLGGEAAGGAIADVLCGKVTPAGKLTETVPSVMRKDLDYPGNEYTIIYKEKLDVGYRYYDKHPDEIRYPFGHGLSYTDFEYKDIEVKQEADKITLSFTVKNIGKVDGAEVAQIYVGDPISTMTKPIKELKAFKKFYIKSGEEKSLLFNLTLKDLAYYNVMLEDWVTEKGEYIFFVGSSSRDIRLKKSIFIDCETPYSIERVGEAMIGCN